MHHFFASSGPARVAGIEGVHCNYRVAIEITWPHMHVETVAMQPHLHPAVVRTTTKQGEHWPHPQALIRGGEGILVSTVCACIRLLIKNES